MSYPSLASLLGLLSPVGRSSGPDRRCGPVDDAAVVAPDQQAAGRQVRTVLVVRSGLDRATVLAAVRHELRLPLGADSVPPGRLHLTRADDSSVTVASVLGVGTAFRAALVVRDAPAGSAGEYRVSSWHQRLGGICGLRQLQHVDGAVRRAVRAVDPEALLLDLSFTEPR